MSKRIAEVVYGDPERNEMNWFLDAEGVLYLSGQGRIPEGINEKLIPWREKKHLIRCVRVAEGVTELGIGAFKDCENLVKVVLPDSLRRIHTDCFYNCRNLSEIQMNGEADFRFIYEPEILKEMEFRLEEGERETKSTEVYDECNYLIKRQIIFSVRSFYGVPWMIKQYGDYYIKNGILYSCFTTDTHILIPEEVHALGRFAFSRTNLEVIHFHKDVAIIEMCAFADTKLKRVKMPQGLKFLAPYAFAGTHLGEIEFSHKGEADISELSFAKSRLSYDLDDEILPDCFELVLRSAGKKLADYKIFKIRKKQLGYELTRRKLVISNLRGKILNVGLNFYRRLQREEAILCICVDEEKKQVLNVRSYSLSREDKAPQEYLMFPYCEDEEKAELGVWSEYITSITPEQLQKMFHARAKSYEIELDTDLRRLMPGVHEYWYQTKDTGTFGGTKEFQFLKQWLEAHPGYRVGTKDENWSKEPYREYIPF